MVVMLIGNKYDLSHTRVVSYEEGEQGQGTWSCLYRGIC